jgi:hypothetical protein
MNVNIASPAFQANPAPGTRSEQLRDFLRDTLPY